MPICKDGQSYGVFFHWDIKNKLVESKLDAVWSKHNISDIILHVSLWL